MLDAV